MQRKSVTSPYSTLPDYPDDINYLNRRLNFEIDSLNIDIVELKIFLWHQYKAFKDPKIDENLRRQYGINCKNSFNYKSVWFISAKRDKAWLFIPSDETREALAKPLIEFFDYPLENDLRFNKNKKFIRKILINIRKDTTFFDIIKGEICTPLDDEEAIWGDWYYNKFNPLESERDNLKGTGPFRCCCCGRFFSPKNFEQNCCSNPMCKKKNRQKNFIEKRRITLSIEKKERAANRKDNPIRCEHCGGILPVNARTNKKYCGTRCRVAAYRLRQS